MEFGLRVVGTLLTISILKSAVLEESCPRVVSGLAAVVTLLAISILKSAALEELCRGVVFGLGFVVTLPTIHCLSCAAVVVLSQRKEFDPLVVGTQLITLVLKSVAPAKLWTSVESGLPAVDLCLIIDRLGCVVPVE